MTPNVIWRQESGSSYPGSMKYTFIDFNTSFAMTCSVKHVTVLFVSQAELFEIIRIRLDYVQTRKHLKNQLQKNGQYERTLNPIH